MNRTRNRNVGRTRLLAFLGAATLPSLAVLGGACSGSTLAAKGQLMLVLTSDMAAPKDFDVLHLEVKRGPDVLHSYDYDIATGPTPNKLPATLAIVSGGDPHEAVDVRVVARQGGATGKARVLRDVRTLVPTDRIAMLPIPIQWLCDGSAVERGGVIEPQCPADQTCIAGACRPITEGTDELPNYDPEQIFGEGSAACFDTLACFGSGQIVKPKAVDGVCSFPTPPPGLGLNVALVGPPGASGICSSAACLLPLESSAVTGFSERSGAVVLPLAVCERLDVVQVAATTTCTTKRATQGTCGEWSTGGLGTVEAPAPLGVEPFAFAMNASPATATLAAGTTATIQLTLSVAGPKVGAVVVTVDGLPNGVTADALTISEGQTGAPLTLRANATPAQFLGNVTVRAASAKAGTTVSLLSLRVKGAGGAADVTFGDQGYVSVPSGAVSAFYALAETSDGKILAAGGRRATVVSNWDVLLARLSPDGKPDPTFNGGSPVVFPLGGANSAVARAVALQTDGKIVVGAHQVLATNGPNDYRLLRFNPDGSQDTSMDSGFVADSGSAYQAGAYPRGLVALADGAVVATTNVFVADGSVTFPRLTWFGADGSVLFHRDVFPAAAGSITALVPGANDTLVVGGTRLNNSFLLARILRDGGTDPMFLDGGALNPKQFTPPNSGKAKTVGGVAVLPDGRMMINGVDDDAGNNFRRTTVNGQDDATFDAGTTEQGRSTGIVVQDDGKVLSLDYNVLVRRVTTGPLDTTFGSSGTIDLSARMSKGEAVILLRDGRIVAGGATSGSQAIIASFWQ